MLSIFRFERRKRRRKKHETTNHIPCPRATHKWMKKKKSTNNESAVYRRQTRHYNLYMSRNLIVPNHHCTLFLAFCSDDGIVLCACIRFSFPTRISLIADSNCFEAKDFRGVHHDVERRQSSRILIERTFLFAVSSFLYLHRTAANRQTKNKTE